MPEFLVHMQFNFPADLTPIRKQELYLHEAARAAELAEAGVFKRVWRIPGRTAHISLWEVPDATVLHECLESWPMFDFMDIQVTPLALNHNDPGGVAEDLPGMQMTYSTLRAVIDAHRDHGHGDADGIELAPGISIHDHPGTDRALQIHFMVDGQKMAEIGPPITTHQFPPGQTQGKVIGESVVPGYIDFLAEWEGRPVRHARWQNRIAKDNGLTHSSYEDALAASRVRRKPVIGQ